MADLKELYPYLFRDAEQALGIDRVAGYFISLELKCCNGSYCTPFSEADLALKATPHPDDNQSKSAASDMAIFIGKYAQVCDHPETLKSLEEFYSNKRHLKCLDYMRQKEKEVELKERDVQTILAAHLFEPLMSGSQIMVDKNSYRGTDDIICPGPGCSKKVRIENTSFGHTRVWHGMADIIAGHTVVKIQREETDTDSEESDETSEAAVKRVKHEDGDGGGSGEARMLRECNNAIIEVKTEKDSYMPHGPDRICPSSFERAHKTLSQVLAQTIVNGFMQVKKNPKLKECFIPTILASPQYVTIHMYNPTHDKLITSAETMFLWTGNELNRSTILGIWLALNMHHNCVFVNNHHLFTESKFHDLVRRENPEALEIYKNHMQMPCKKEIAVTTSKSYNYRIVPDDLNLVKDSYEKLRKKNIRTKDQP